MVSHVVRRKQKTNLQVNSSGGQRVIKMLRQRERLLQPLDGLLGSCVYF